MKLEKFRGKLKKKYQRKINHWEKLAEKYRERMQIAERRIKNLTIVS